MKQYLRISFTLFIQVLSFGLSTVAFANGQALSAETRYVEADGTNYAYRELGTGEPVVLFQRFRARMNDWDPQFLDRLAQTQRVIVFDNAGVGLSDGVIPATISEMADDAASFIRALGLEQVDVLGWSMGGAVAQAIAINHPDLVRRVVLAGTAPGGEGTRPTAEEVVGLVTKETDVGVLLEDYTAAFFTSSEASSAAAKASFERIAQYTETIPTLPQETWPAQLNAYIGWLGGQDPSQANYQSLTQPVLAANGDRDVVTATINSVYFVDRLPNAQLIIYPDSGHGFLFQHDEDFVARIQAFLR